MSYLNTFYELYDKKFVNKNAKKFFSINAINEKTLLRFLRFLEYKNEMKNVVNTKDYYCLLYGEEMGIIEFDKRNKNRLTPYNKQYWINKGYDEKVALEKIKNYKTNKATSKDQFINRHGIEKGLDLFKKFQNTSKHTLDKFIEKYSHDGYTKYQEYLSKKDSMSINWALKKCNNDLNAALALLKDRKKSVLVTYDTILARVKDEKLASKIWFDINDKKRINFNWALKKCDNDYIKATELYAKLLKKRRVKYGNASKSSLKLLKPLFDYLNNNLLENERIFLEIPESDGFFLYDKKNKRSYCYDFCFLGNSCKFIIEFNGIKWHPRYEKYKIDELLDIMPFYKNEIQIMDKIKYDETKIKLAEEYGYDVLILWDDDSEEINKIKIVDFLNKSKIKFNYEN